LVIRPVRQPEAPTPSGSALARSPEIRYAIPVSHSHQFLCVEVRPVTTVLAFCGERVGHVPHFVTRVGRRVAERPQQVGLALPVAHARHLRAALLGAAGHAGDVRQIARPRGIGDVHDRGAVVLLATGERIARPAAVVADVGQDTPALAMDRGLVGRAALQVVVADQFHVLGFGAVTARRRLRGRDAGRQQRRGEGGKDPYEPAGQRSHGLLQPQCRTI
jgi:hypothetical protein